MLSRVHIMEKVASERGVLFGCHRPTDYHRQAGRQTGLGRVHKVQNVVSEWGRPIWLSQTDGRMDRQTERQAGGQEDRTGQVPQDGEGGHSEGLDSI